MAGMSLLTGAQLAFYRKHGRLTVPGVFVPQLTDEIIDDIEHAMVFDHPALPYNHELKLRTT
jgi:hypothetical protein